MDAATVKDVTATGLGGASGLDMIYTGVQGMLEGGVDGSEIKLVAYGLFAIIAGFFAWRRTAVAPAPAPATPAA